MPGYAKIIMLLQSMVILFLTFWVLQEYTYNIYFQAYVNDMVQTNGSLIAILVFVSSLGLALGLFKALNQPTSRLELSSTGRKLRPWAQSHPRLVPGRTQTFTRW